MNADKRNQVRKHIDTSIKVNENSGFYHNAKGADVSLGGLCLITGKTDIEAGQVFKVQFDLLLRGRLMKVEAQAKVVHKVAFGSYDYKVGLAFTNLDTLSAWTVESFVSNDSDMLPPLPSTSIWGSMHSDE